MTFYTLGSQEYFKHCLDHMRNYPQVYSIQEITSLTGGKFVSDISLNFEKQLLAMVRYRLQFIIMPLYVGVDDMTTNHDFQYNVHLDTVGLLTDSQQYSNVAFFFKNK